MSKKSLTAVKELLPTLFDDYFKPWSEWFDHKGWFHHEVSVPAVNITDEKDKYNVTLAAPGLKKENFSIDVHGNLLSISAERSDEKDSSDKKFTRKEYNYSSFSRSFNLPQEIVKENIEANYSDGILTINLPKKEILNKEDSLKVNVK